MRQYPRRVYKSKTDHKIIGDEFEERLASKEGYEYHWNPVINEQNKGTEKGILREEAVKKVEKVVPQEEPEEPAKDIKPTVLKEVKKRTRKPRK